MFASQTRLDDETRLGLRRQRLGNRAAGLANSLRGMGTGAQPTIYGQLSGFQKPALFLAGQKDRKFLELGRRMSGLTPKGKFESISDVGHCAHLENLSSFVRRSAIFWRHWNPRLDVSPSPGPEGEALYSVRVKRDAQALGAGGREKAVGRDEGRLEEVVGEWGLVARRRRVGSRPRWRDG